LYGFRAKGYTDNVVDLMVGKLQRLSATTQNALNQLTCLGNVAEIAWLSPTILSYQLAGPSLIN
jgi:predicted ATPase